MMNKPKQWIALAGLCACQFVWADVESGLAALAQQDYPKAKTEFEIAAKQGNAEAQYSLGHLYESGEGITRNYAEALQWYRKAAEQGFTLAQNNLGFMYENGQGVKRNYPEAVKWFRKAADQGYALAQYNLGRIYAQGVGIAQDYVQSYKWTALAAAQADEGAIKNINLLAPRMTLAQIASAKELVANWLKQHGAAGGSPNPGKPPDDSISPENDADKTFRL